MSIEPQPASPTKETAMLTARVDRELLAAFDALAEGRGGRSALLRTVLQQALKHVSDAPLIAPRADSAGNRVSLRFTDAETAVLDYRATERGIDRAGWIMLARVVRRTPEVLVKVTGRKKGAKHLAAHLDYIGRHGDIPLETRDGEEITTKEDRHRVADEWSDPLYWRQGTTVSAVAMVFSMPAGTDPETVKQAVRETSERMIGDNHDYLMALHTDTPRPHVHLTVQAEGLNRKRFDPRREDLFRFREAFAEALRSRGVEAEATPRYTRGQGRAGTSMALTQLRARIRSGASHQPTEADLRQAREAMQIALGKAQQPAFVLKTRERWQDTKRRYEGAAERLDRSGDHEDRKLARDVRQFIQERASIETIPDRMLREAEARVKEARARGTAPPEQGVPRGTPPPPTRQR